jgi:hypothetical protein
MTKMSEEPPKFGERVFGLEKAIRPGNPVTAAVLDVGRAAADGTCEAAPGVGDDAVLPGPTGDRGTLAPMARMRTIPAMAAERPMSPRRPDPGHPRRYART